MTEPFTVETGLKQGCPLSCALFNMALEWIMRRVPLAHDPLRLQNGVVLDRLGYADDVDFAGESFEPRDAQITVFRTESGRVGLNIKESKTKVMKMARTARDVDFVEVAGLMLEVVDSFKYLGSTVTTDNDMTEEIKIRISSASKCSWAMKEVLNSRILSRRTKLQAFTAILRPIATYACET